MCNLPNIIIAHLAGGLGNQMFQYAAARRLSLVHGVPLKLDLSSYGPDGDTQAKGLEAFARHARVQKLKIVAEEATAAEIALMRDPYLGNSRTTSRIVRQARRFFPKLGWPITHFQERQYRFDPEVLNLRPPIYLSGFWQSEKYFADFGAKIREELSPVDSSIVESAQHYVSEIRAPGNSIVSLHVRRGELAVAAEKLRSTKGVFGPPTGLAYIQSAMRQFDPSCKFLVFSDSAPDIEWCKQNIHADHLHFSEGRNDIEDMMLMSACDHHIIASTFSWWAAWLNSSVSKRIVAPRQWGHPGGPMVPDDLIPSEWTMI